MSYTISLMVPPINEEGEFSQELLDQIAEKCNEPFADVRIWYQDHDHRRSLKSEVRLCTRSGNTDPVYAESQVLIIIKDLWANPDAIEVCSKVVEDYLNRVIKAVSDAVARVPESELIERSPDAEPCRVLKLS